MAATTGSAGTASAAGAGTAAGTAVGSLPTGASAGGVAGCSATDEPALEGDAVSGVCSAASCAGVAAFDSDASCASTRGESLTAKICAVTKRAVTKSCLRIPYPSLPVEISARSSPRATPNSRCRSQVFGSKPYLDPANCRTGPTSLRQFLRHRGNFAVAAAGFCLPCLDRGRGHPELDALVEQGRSHSTIQPVDVSKGLHFALLVRHRREVGEMNRDRPVKRN